MELYCRANVMEKIGVFRKRQSLMENRGAEEREKKKGRNV